MINYQELIKKALENGISEIEIVVSKNTDLEMNYFNGNIETNKISDITKINVHGIYNGKMAYLNIENLDTPIDEIITRIKNNASFITASEEVMIYEGSKEYPNIVKNRSDYHEVTMQEKIAMLASIEKKIKEKDKRIVYIPFIEYEESSNSKQIINSKGLNISKGSEYCVVAVQAVAKENDETQSGFKVVAKKNFDELNPENIINEVVEKAVSMFNAKPIESGNYEIVVENEAMRDLFSTFESIFTGEAALKKITPLLGKENEKIMSELISIEDMPLKDDALVRAPFDDEGVACYNKTVVEKGVFKGMLHNLKTGKAFNTTSTGNGFSRSVGGCNLFIKEGNTSKEDMIKSVKKGLLLTGFDGLHAGVNAISGDYSLKTYGFLIENGKIIKPVSLIVVSGNFLKMMNDVEMVGSDLLLDHESIGAPSIKFKSLSISGN